MFGEALTIVGSLIAAGTAAAHAIERRKGRRRRELVDAWRTAAQHLGLTLDTGIELRLFGSIGSIAVRIETGHEAGNGGIGEVTRFQLEDAARLPLTFRMRRRARSGWLVPEIETSGMATGDPHLDSVAVVRGNEVRLAAILSKETRDLIRLAVGVHGAAIGYGRITHREFSHIRDERRLVGVLHLLRDFANALAIEDAAIPRALYRNLSDPLPGVRHRNFQLLFEYFPASQEAKLALPLAMSDPDPMVRLSAALGKGVDGIAEVVAAIDDPWVDISIKIFAIRQMALRFRGWLVDDTLIKLLHSPNDRLVSAALRAVAASENQRMLPHLIELIAKAERSEPVMVDAIAAAGSFDDPKLEPALIPQLEHPFPSVRLAAIHALSSIGTIAAIEHLLESSSGLFIPRMLKETARRAIRRIQDRFYIVAGHGLLSLVEEDQAGDLSLSSSDGSLSLRPLE